MSADLWMQTALYTRHQTRKRLHVPMIKGSHSRLKAKSKSAFDII
jgi:hypothetical protein